MLRKEAADGLVRVIERLNSGSSASDNIHQVVIIIQVITVEES